MVYMRVYFDNCCYNRPYDDQSQIRIHLETEAKLHIQELIKNGKLELVTSFVLFYENDKNRVMHKKQAISEFMNMNGAYYVSGLRKDALKEIAKPIMDTGVKEKDAYHVACSILAKADYFITTDDRLLKYQTAEVAIVTPGEFIRRLEEKRNE